MSEPFIIFLIGAISALAGAYVGNLIARLKIKSETGKMEERLSQLKDQEERLNERFQTALNDKEKIREEKDFLNAELVRRNSENDHLEKKLIEQKDELEQLQEKFTKEFENLANKILDNKSEKFTKQNKEQIDTILKPLQEKIDRFEKKVDTSQKESLTMHAALKEQLLGLKDLNLQMTKDATNLTRALKGDSKLQGNWGELVLERVLEKSGLEKDREYFVQQSFAQEDGSRVMPDVVIHLPDKKKMVIDSKVSITDYNRYVNAEDEEKEIHLKAHINSINKHVEQLSDKNYQDLYDIESPDFVLMFIPIEPAFAVAINQDNNLYTKAFEKNIVIVTPSTLLATLRTIDTMWNNEKQQRNAIEIARQAGALYDKFEGLLKDLTGIGKKMDDAKRDYSAAMNKLVEGRGNLITSVEKLKKMGAKAKKSLPENIMKRAKESE
ncbi:DNA recombination protein RmuC [Aureisphaera galaxeae]|uniref:DNA recombination protein RmuC n=1 Tax=Aureisphaera galaxeae TaxID=1538023 RepID=UPI002350763E|nr:DNA recombination protein RmuC [Aureisphaera galaxeae]MDC8003652.1 DNA recombination protein RmuC [Aureisphaera galaxeae]